MPIQPMNETLEDSRASKEVSKSFSLPRWDLENSTASKEVSKYFYFRVILPWDQASSCAPLFSIELNPKTPYFLTCTRILTTPEYLENA